jgi:pimeloyl-ACP methyl ester carboxylesterase
MFIQGYFAAMQNLILLHGALGNALSLAPLKAAMQADFEVHVPEFSGHGNAEWPEDGFSMSRFGEDLLRYMESAGLDDTHVFGYSMGGFVALRTAIAHPGRIKSITALATKFAWTPETSAKEAGGLDADLLLAKAPKFIDALDAAHPRGGWRKVLNATADMLGRMCESVIPDQSLQNLEIPVQLLLGERDKMVSREETLHARGLLQKGSFGILPAMPHPLESVDLNLLAALIRSGIERAGKG